MARRGGRSSSTNGGIGGSGIFGVMGTTIRCDSEDDSFYCNFMKFFNVIITLGVLAYFAYFLYTIVIPWFMKRSKR